MILATILAIALAAGGTIADPAACAVIAEDAERLACYDSIFMVPGRAEPAEAMAMAPAPVAAAAAATAAAPVTKKSPEDEFGLTAGQLRELSAAGTLDRIRAEVVGLEAQGSGRPVLVLANDQRWRQVEATDRTLFTVGETVEIRGASFGSFLASVPGSGRPAVRVRRLE